MQDVSRDMSGSASQDATPPQAARARKKGDDASTAGAARVEQIPNSYGITEGDSSH